MKKLLLLMLSANLAAAEMVLVKDGVPRAEIVLRERPAASAQLAAFELNHHVKMITGTAFPVKYGKGSPEKLHIELGGDDKPAGKEYSSIRFTETGIRIFGSDDPIYRKVNYNNPGSFPKQYTGTLFGVYDFLEKYCGVRWYGLTDDATALVPRKTLAVQVKDHDHSSPTDAFRGLHNSGGRANMLKVVNYTPRDEALMKLRWRNASYFGQTNHNVYRIYFHYWGKARKKQYAALFRERREKYFAHGYRGRMVPLDGFLRREYPDDADCPPGICFSEPEVVDFFAEQAVEQWNGMPMVGLPANGYYQKRLEGKPFFSSVQHQDTQGPCFCPKCTERRQAIGENNLMWQWIADIADAAAKKQPGLGISTLAYQRSLAYPDKVQLPDNLCVQMCLGIHAWWNPEFYRIQHDGIYKKWVQNKGGKVLSVWLYLFGPSWDSKTRYKHKFFPGIYPRHAGKIAGEMSADGIRGAFLECELYCNMLTGYVVSKIFYDPSLDPDAVVDEHFTLFYGKAAPEMKAFFTELEDIYWNWKNYPASMFGKDGVASRLRAHSLGSGMLNADNNWSVGTAERMERLSGLIAAAEKKADSPLVRKRISWIRKGFWDQAVEGRRDHVRRRKVNSIPEKNLIVNRVENAQGDPAKIDWENQVSAGDCHTMEDGTIVPGAFDLKIAADNEYLYFDFQEKKEQKKLGLWGNFFELFLSGSDRNRVTQIAINPATVKPLLYLTEMINDVFHTRSTAFKVNFKQLETEKSWHWQMSFPISAIGDADLRRFNMNFRRYDPENKLVWNKFFSSAAECTSCMGYVAVKGGASRSEYRPGFKEGRIRNEIGNWFLNKGTISFTSDPDTAMVRMPAGDILVCTQEIPAVPGDHVTVRWKAEGTAVPSCSIQMYSGKKQLGLKSAKAVSKGGNEFEMTLRIPDKITAFRLFFRTSKTAEFRLEAPTVIIGGGKQK